MSDDERVEMIARVIEPWSWLQKDRAAGGDVTLGIQEHITDSLAKARAILALLPAQSAWQGIETAPKDKSIMLCVEGFEPCSGRWYPPGSCWASFDWEGAFESDEEADSYFNATKYEPTHWQPLPLPPSQSAPAPLPVAGEREAAIEKLTEIAQFAESNSTNGKNRDRETWDVHARGLRDVIRTLSQKDKASQ